MLSLCILNLVKTSLKSLYDIEPLVVDHLLLGAKVHATLVASRSAHLFSGVSRAVRGAVPPVQSTNESVALA